jgi:hypothetical protein
MDDIGGERVTFAVTGIYKTCDLCHIPMPHVTSSAPGGLPYGWSLNIAVDRDGQNLQFTLHCVGCPLNSTKPSGPMPALCQ